MSECMEITLNSTWYIQSPQEVLAIIIIIALVGGHRAQKPKGGRSADHISRGLLPTAREDHFS